MSAPVDVLAVFARSEGQARMVAGLADDPRARQLLKDLAAARAAVAELIEAADAALAVLGAYAEKIEGEWGVCLKLDQMLAKGEEPEYVALRDALDRVKRGAA